MDKGFLYRRLGFLAPCVLRQSKFSQISLANKHVMSAFQDVYLNPFYWEAILKIPFKPEIIFDLGANFGLFSSLCSHVLNYQFGEYEKSFYLIEANKKLVNRLRKESAHLIPLQKVELIYGLAGPIQDTAFTSNKHNLLASKITEKGVTVPFINLNKLPKPHLLKIDIEGAEALLLDHYLDWCKQAKAIIIEFHLTVVHRKHYEELLQLAGFELILNRLEASGFHNQLWLKKES